MQVILASASPRRQQLLQMVVPEFVVHPADVEETMPPEIDAGDAAEYLCEQKARAVAQDYPANLVIGCDTIVAAGGKLLGKPKDEAECRQMLGQLSGKTHQVYTGVCLMHGEHCHVFSVCTDVSFYPLSPQERDSYIATGEPFDKAGGYGVQGLGALLVERIDGDYYNVVGLPIARLLRELSAFMELEEGSGWSE